MSSKSSKDMKLCDRNGNAAQLGVVQMSFRDWKIQKDSQNNDNTTHKRRPNKIKWNSSSGSGSKMYTPPSLLSLRFDQNLYRNNAQPSFDRPPPSFGAGGFGGGMQYNGQKFNSGFSGPRGYNRNGDNVNCDILDTFFQTDDFYPQNDMLQEPFLDSPFCNNPRVRKSFNKLRDSNNSPQPDRLKTNKIGKLLAPKPEITHKLEPKVFVRNPNRKETKKPFIPMPKHPESEPNLTAEERKQQWRDYREAMKPFKNRDFYNAKRVVQRLGNKDPSELDEKQKFRLANAQERMAAYKQKLAEKYDSYVKSTDKTPNGGGELYVLKKGNAKGQWTTAEKPAQYKNYGNFGQSSSPTMCNDMGISSGRKIVGGSSSCQAAAIGNFA